MSYSKRTREIKNRHRKAKKPRPSAKHGKHGRTTARAGKKAIHRPGSLTWCRARGIPGWGEGENRVRKTGAK